MNLRPLHEYPFSLRARVTSWYAGLLAVALVVFSIGIYLGVRTYLKMTLQRGLIATAHTIADDFLDKLPTKGDAWVLGEVRESYDASPNDHFVRLSTGKQVLFQTGDMRDPPIDVEAIPLPAQTPPAPHGLFQIGDWVVPVMNAEGTFHRETVRGNRVLVYSLPYKTSGGRVIDVEAGVSLYMMQQTLRSLSRILIVATVAILVLAATGGYFLMKQPLRPLAVLTDKAARIGRTELGERLPVIRTGDELERLTYSLNGMIERLEEALNHNQRFSADASHELRTPLTILRGELEEMLQMEELPVQAGGNLVSALDEIDRMSRIVNSLMTITRLDAGSERMDMEPVDLSSLVTTTMEHMRPLADEKQLSLSCLCAPGVQVMASPMRIKQVLVNLTDNAIKYSLPREAPGDGRERNGIRVTVFASGDRAYLTIRDQGIGIPAEVLPHVFERFYRGDFARSREAGGVGLGLAIVKAIVTAHDGTVSIGSTPQQGSTVTVELPLLKVWDPAMPEPEGARKKMRYQTT